MTKTAFWAVSLGMLIGLPSLAWAQEGPAPFSAADKARLERQQQVLSEPDIVWAHPDLRYRELGTDAYNNGNKKRALGMLQEAARYGDKPSQAMIAAMYWSGDGVEVDRPRAYAWMDLAADRGYHDLIVQRELYWNRLSETEREKALKIGQEVYAEYSDEQGRRRLALQLGRGGRRITGSHAGYVGSGMASGAYSSLMTLDRASGAHLDLDANRFNLQDLYGSTLWNADEYLSLKDRQWQMKGPLRGNVEVGPLEVARPSTGDTQPPA